MTVTADQAKMLTTLGLAMRPYAAPRFDGRGLHAQIVRVERMSLAEVTQVVVAVCTDPSLETPANIGDTKSRHWDGIHVVGAEPRARDVAPVGSRCTTCGLTKPDHDERYTPTGDQARDEAQGRHEFARPIESHAEHVRTIVTELRGHVPATRTTHPIPESEARRA